MKTGKFQAICCVSRLQRPPWESFHRLRLTSFQNKLSYGALHVNANFRRAANCGLTRDLMRGCSGLLGTTQWIDFFGVIQLAMVAATSSRVARLACWCFMRSAAERPGEFLDDF